MSDFIGTRPTRPAYLIAYPFLKPWLKRRHGLHYRRWVLDSGAWSAFNAGVVIDLEQFTDHCHELLAGVDPPHEVFALDVIGDYHASMRNALRMRERGVDAIPTFHYGEPAAHLRELAAAFPKIAIGGVANQPAAVKLKFGMRCLETIWPKKVHGFAFCERLYTQRIPFDSVDATAWAMQPVMYKRFRLSGDDRKVYWDVRHARATGKLDTKMGDFSLEGDVEYFLRIESEARAKWRNAMAEINSDGPTLYLALGDFTNRTGHERRDGDEPDATKEPADRQRRPRQRRDARAGKDAAR